MQREAARRWISRTSRSSSAPGVGKAEHWATALNQEGRKVFDRALPNDEDRLRALYEKLASHGSLLVVVDQPATIGALMFFKGLWRRPGVYNVEEFDPDPFLEEVAKQGLPWHEHLDVDIEFEA